jgi:hypothetical protein
MRRTADGWENALMERVLGTAKTECADRQRFTTRTQSTPAICA